MLVIDGTEFNTADMFKFNLYFNNSKNRENCAYVGTQMTWFSILLEVNSSALQKIPITKSCCIWQTLDLMHAETPFFTDLSGPGNASEELSFTMKYYINLWICVTFFGVYMSAWIHFLLIHWMYICRNSRYYHSAVLPLGNTPTFTLTKSSDFVFLLFLQWLKYYKNW